MFILLSNLYICVYLCLCRLKRAPVALELELKAFVNHLMWALGSLLWPSGRVAGIQLLSHLSGSWNYFLHFFLKLLFINW